LIPSSSSELFVRWLLFTMAQARRNFWVFWVSGTMIFWGVGLMQRFAFFLHFDLFGYHLPTVIPLLFFCLGRLSSVVFSTAFLPLVFSAETAEPFSFLLAPLYPRPSFYTSSFFFPGPSLILCFVVERSAVLFPP